MSAARSRADTRTLARPVVPVTRFALPPDSEASAPAERRGLARDAVRLLVARSGQIEHATFRDLDQHLTSGDVVVVNTSATLPAAVDVHRAGHTRSPLHVATELDDGSWVVEVRAPANTGPADDVHLDDVLEVTGGARLRVVESYPAPGIAGSRLWRVISDAPGGAQRYLADHGRPIRYGYLSAKWPLGDVQTVYADEPGSAEMPSAGRPFSHRLLVRLMMRGVTVAPIVLHTGVSSPEKHEPPMPERYRIPAATADLVNLARSRGRRVVAVGTTVTRALETMADLNGTVSPGAGWTDLLLGPDRPARVVDGLISGLHEPEASHLLLLEAVAGPDLVRRAYNAAVSERYLWHEFGDSMLFLPLTPERSARSSQRAG